MKIPVSEDDLLAVLNQDSSGWSRAAQEAKDSLLFTINNPSPVEDYHCASCDGHACDD